MSRRGSLGCGLVEGRWLLLVCACWGEGAGGWRVMSGLKD